MRASLTLAVAVAAAGLSACKGTRPSPSRSQGHTDAAPPAHAAAKTPKPAKAGTETAAAPIRWMNGDYKAALARARAEHKALVIDEWTHWCDACRSMKNILLADAAFKPFAGRFVWLAVDVDKRENAALLGKFPAPAHPTFYVVEPDLEQVEALQLGSATVADFRAFLVRGAQGSLTDRASGGETGAPLDLVVNGDRAFARKRYVVAARAYAAALAAAPARWPQRVGVLASELAALTSAGRWKKCAALARRSINRRDATPSVTDFAAFANRCAAKLGDKKKATHLRLLLIARVSQLLARSHVLSAIDRDHALRLQASMYAALDRPLMARRLTRARQRILDKAYAAARTPLLKMTYLRSRTEVYIALGDENRIIPDLDRAMAAFPREPDPPYALALVYNELRKRAEAARMASRAAALAHGPRKAAAQELAVDIDRARGDAAAESQALAALIATLKSLPKQARNPSAEKKARAERAALRKARSGKRTLRRRRAAGR